MTQFKPTQPLPQDSPGKPHATSFKAKSGLSAQVETTVCSDPSAITSLWQGPMLCTAPSTVGSPPCLGLSVITRSSCLLTASQLLCWDGSSRIFSSKHPAVFYPQIGATRGFDRKPAESAWSRLAAALAQQMQQPLSAWVPIVRALPYLLGPITCSGRGWEAWSPLMPGPCRRTAPCYLPGSKGQHQDHPCTHST